jgi:hypothetical protein
VSIRVLPDKSRSLLHSFIWVLSNASENYDWLIKHSCGVTFALRPFYRPSKRQPASHPFQIFRCDAPTISWWSGVAWCRDCRAGCKNPRSLYAGVAENPNTGGRAGARGRVASKDGSLNPSRLPRPRGTPDVSLWRLSGQGTRLDRVR